MTYAERTKGLKQPGCGLKTTEWLLKGYEFSRKHGAYLTQKDVEFLDRLIADMRAEIVRFRARGPEIHMPIGGHA